jgi:hypothetical protein
MRKLRSHGPLVLLAVALAAFVGGTALAGPIADVARKITGKDIAKNAIVSKHVKKNALTSVDIAKLKAKDFLSSERAKLVGPRGPQGDKGDTGAAGAAGAAGTPGTPGTSGTNGTDGADAIGGWAGHAGIVQNSTRYTPLFGSHTAQPNETDGQGLTPNKNLVMKDFAAAVTSGLPVGETLTFTVRVAGAPTAITCGIVGAGTMCTSAAQITIPARSLVTMQVVSTAAVVENVTWSWTYEEA